MKKNVVLLVDGENISYKRAEKIRARGRRLGRNAVIRVYHRSEDLATRHWSSVARQYGFRDVLIEGDARKNKVDERLMRDARRMVASKNIHTICVVSSDSDFAVLGALVSGAGKRLCIMGEEKAPERLRRAGKKFMLLGD